MGFSAFELLQVRVIDYKYFGKEEQEEVELRIHIPLVPEAERWTVTGAGLGLSIVDVHLSKLVYRMQLRMPG